MKGRRGNVSTNLNNLANECVTRASCPCREGASLCLYFYLSVLMEGLLSPVSSHTYPVRGFYRGQIFHFRIF